MRGRRFQRPPGRRRPLPLLRANRMMEDGQFAQAARLFDRLAVGAQQRGMPIRAANLALRAAQAYLAQDEIDPALYRIRRAIRVLARHGRAERVAQVLAHAQDELRQKGYDTQTVELAQSAAGVLEEAGLSLDDFHSSRSAQAAEARGSLPGRCEGRGAPLVPGHVIWHDTRTAECPCCGAVIKAT